MNPEIKKKIQTWLNGNYDDATKAEIRELLKSNNEDELTDAFYKDLELGTGGLRGIMGAGSNRMNKYTIGMATQGLSNYLIKCFVGKNKSKSNNPPPITPVRSYPSTVVPPYGVNNQL